MLGKTYESQVCSISRTLEMVGERWSLLIIRNAAFAGMTRFGEFRRSLGIATNVLQSRLDGFVEHGLMERRPSPEQPTVPEYVLTDKGSDLVPALVALTAWGDRWAAPDGPPILYRHAGCGDAVGHHLTCTTCGLMDDPTQVEAHPGPGMPEERAAVIRQRLATG
ncbi:winged helix-turn-helix transcriptional regulator [Occultella gossypii]|uniref:Helix-turn-helix transcriptional regulator n=1 Tax=Occultella gossypii TaxID=2800820 RepID=A0ABS7SJQ0_9MICO|nr:helix-turn-helix domain-containing protein [Occultella gossypii]MBZ2199523.1 helix-turn-helix transcriptional regulator [Occultella gossypii]